MHIIDIVRAHMIQAGLIDAVVSPLYDQDKEVRLDAIHFAARMAFYGTGNSYKYEL